MIETLSRQIQLPELSKRAKQLGNVFQAFEVDIEEDDIILNAINKLTDLHINHTLTLQQLFDALQTLVEITKHLDDGDWDIIEQLATSQGLVTFLREVADEDLRNLIDAVEERSEQHVSESTMSDLIDVKRYMEALLTVQPPNQTMKLIEVIQLNRPPASKVKRLPTQINSCVHNVHDLRDLYNNVANRGERTKQIIRNALQQGVYSFVMG